MPLLSAEKGVGGWQDNMCLTIPKATATAAATAAATTTATTAPRPLPLQLPLPLMGSTNHIQAVYPEFT